MRLVPFAGELAWFRVGEVGALEEEENPSVIGFDVAFGVFDFGFFTCCFVGEVVVTHGDGLVTEHLDGVVVEADFGPWFEGKAFVFRVFGIAGDEVGEGAFEVGAEGCVGSEGGLELDGSEFEGVSCFGCLFGDCFGIFSCADGYDGVAPHFLGGFDIGFGDGGPFRESIHVGREFFVGTQCGWDHQRECECQ